MTQTTHDPLERELSALFATPVSYDVGELTESVHAGVRQVRKTRRRRRVLAGTSALALAGIVTTAALSGGLGGTNNLNLPGSLATPAATTPGPTEPFVPAVGEKFDLPYLELPDHQPGYRAELVKGPLSGAELRSLIAPEHAFRAAVVPPVNDAPRLSFGLVQQQDLGPRVGTYKVASYYLPFTPNIWRLQSCSEDRSKFVPGEVEFRIWNLTSMEGSAGRSERPHAFVVAARYVQPAQAKSEYHALLTDTGNCRLDRTDNQYQIPDHYPVSESHGEPFDRKGVSFRLVRDTIVVVSDTAYQDQFGKLDTKQLADNVVERIKLTNDGAPWSSSTSG